MKTPLADLMRDFEQALQGASSIHPTAKGLVRTALPERLERYFRLPENRDHRCVRSHVKRHAETTVKQLTRAARYADDHPDANIRSRAKELVRSVTKLCFEDLALAASRFIGRVNKVGHRRRERERHAERNTWVIARNAKLVELNSLDQIQHAGRVLGLCVADLLWARDYYEGVRSGDALVLRFDRPDGPAGLLHLKLKKKCFAEVDGRGHELLKLSRTEALNVMREFWECETSDIDAFTRVGAFREFLEGTPAPVKLRQGDVEMRVWRFPDAVILSLRDRAQGRTWWWSRFEYEGPRWRGRAPGRSLRRRRLRVVERPFVEGCHHTGALSLGEFLSLLLSCPELYEVLG